MPWRVRDVMNERMRFVVRLEAGEKMTDLCLEFGISRKTGYKFWQRYKEQGPDGLFDESRRPARLARQTAEAIRQEILGLKKEHPTWGSKKLHAKLVRRHDGVKIPCRGTIHLLLDRHGLVKRRKRRRSNAGEYWTTALPQSNKPNDVWCADFKGQFQMGNDKYCYPLTITDHYSRYFIGCEGLENTRAGSARCVFEAAFREYGMPLAICTDNGSPFASSGFAGLTRLSVWWLRLGINIYRIEPGHPEQNGRHERLHLTLKQETTRPAGSNLLQQQERFDAFLETYNNERPHEAIEMKYPAEVYQPSIRKFPTDMQPLVYPLHDIVRTVSDDGFVSLKGSSGKAFYLGGAFAGENVGLRELDDYKWIVTFMSMDLGHFDIKTCNFQPLLRKV